MCLIVYAESEGPRSLIKAFAVCLQNNRIQQFDLKLSFMAQLTL